MSTKKPFSTISFNSETFLRSVLSSLEKDGSLQYYAFIKHYAEEDTKKDHYHIFFLPAKPLDPISLRKKFIELVIGDKPLQCLPFQPSKISDWILYALHDITYLNKKGLVRLNHYSIEEIITNDDDFTLQSYYDAKETFNDNRLTLFLNAMKQGMTFGAILRQGIVPPNQIVYWEKVYATSFKSCFGKLVDDKKNLKIPDIIDI